MYVYGKNLFRFNKNIKYILISDECSIFGTF